MEALTIGVDVGNYDTKTQNCVFPSGYSEYSTKPEIATKILEYGGKFYVPNISERMPYLADKTTDNRCLILTVLGIANEILEQATEQVKKGKIRNPQQFIDQVREIKLGVGLPPGHFNDQKKKLEKYYHDALDEKIKFKYTDHDKNYEFCIKMIKLHIFPQDFMAVYKNINCKYSDAQRYYIVGIGGGTVDVVPVKEKMPDANSCFSLDLGTRIMCNKIAADIQRQYGQMPDENLVEDVLKGNFTVLSDDIKELIDKDAKKHFDNIINECIQYGVKLNLYPTIFFGGGCILLEKYIRNSNMLKDPEILKDVKANAKAYVINIDK